MSPLDAGTVSVTIDIDSKEALADVLAEIEQLERRATSLRREMGRLRCASAPLADYELVRVSRELVDQLTREDSEPVVVLGIDRYDDGTINLVIRTAPSAEEALDA